MLTGLVMTGNLDITGIGSSVKEAEEDFKGKHAELNSLVSSQGKSLSEEPSKQEYTVRIYTGDSMKTCKKSSDNDSFENALLGISDLDNYVKGLPRKFEVIRTYVSFIIAFSTKKSTVFLSRRLFLTSSLSTLPWTSARGMLFTLAI